MILLDVIIEVQKGLDWVNWSLENQYHTSKLRFKECNLLRNSHIVNFDRVLLIKLL